MHRTLRRLLRRRLVRRLRRLLRRQGPLRRRLRSQQGQEGTQLLQNRYSLAHRSLFPLHCQVFSFVKRYPFQIAACLVDIHIRRTRFTITSQRTCCRCLSAFANLISFNTACWQREAEGDNMSAGFAGWHNCSRVV